MPAFFAKQPQKYAINAEHSSFFMIRWNAIDYWNYFSTDLDSLFHFNVIFITVLLLFRYGGPWPWDKTDRENPRMGDCASTDGKCGSTIFGIYRTFLYCWNCRRRILDLKRFKIWNKKLIWSFKLFIEATSLQDQWQWRKKNWNKAWSGNTVPSFKSCKRQNQSVSYF